jgi:hypothetical protein
MAATQHNLSSFMEATWRSTQQKSAALMPMRGETSGADLYECVKEPCSANISIEKISELTKG